MNKLMDHLKAGGVVIALGIAGLALTELLADRLAQIAQRRSGVYVFVSYVIKREEKAFACEQTKFLSAGFNQYALAIIRNELKADHSITNDPDLIILNLTRLETK